MSEAEPCRLAIVALEDAYQAVFSAARVGMTAEEVDAILRARLAAHQAELLPSSSSPYVVAEGGAPPKMRLNRVPLRAGALWGMDTTIRRLGYCADLGRYGYFGPVPAALQEAHRQVLARQELIEQAIRPGRSVRMIFEAVPHDLPFEIHRIGTEGNMLPMCGNATKAVLQAMAESERAGLTFQVGQVICIEIWAGLKGGIEDMYILEAEGVRRLSLLPREIRAVRVAGT